MDSRRSLSPQVVGGDGNDETRGNAGTRDAVDATPERGEDNEPAGRRKRCAIRAV